MFSITFKAADGAIEGYYPITVEYSKGDIIDKDTVSVMPTISDGSIQISGKLIRGDINLDGRLNHIDSMTLARYIVTTDEEKKAALFTDKQKQSADLYPYPEGQIDVRDGIALARLIVMDIGSADTGNAGGREVSLMSEGAGTEIDVGSCRGMPGSIVEVPVTVKNNGGFAGFNFVMNYDKNYLTPVSVSNGELLDATDIEVTSNLTDMENSSKESVAVYFGNWQNTVKDGELFSVKFKISESAPINTELPIGIEYNDGVMCSVQGTDINNVALTVNPGLITTIAGPRFYSVTGVTITTADGNSCHGIPVNGNVDLNVTVTKLTEDYKSALVIAAAYDKNGVLVSLNPRALTEEDLESGACRVHIEECETDIEKVKIFIWSTLEGMLPLASEYIID